MIERYLPGCDWRALNPAGFKQKIAHLLYLRRDELRLGQAALGL